MHDICPHLFTALKQFEKHRISEQGTAITSAERTRYSDGSVSLRCKNLRHRVKNLLDQDFGDLVVQFEREQICKFVVDEWIYPPCTIKIKD